MSDISFKKTENKTDFKPFLVGTVFNPMNVDRKKIRKEPYCEVVINYPSRVEAMAIDPSKIAANDNLRYTPGQIDFTVGLFKKVTVKVIDGSGVVVSDGTKRPTLVRHAVELMRAAIGFEQGFYVDVEDKVNMRHCGLGSSSGLIAGVACAINEMFGRPINDSQMVKYLAQNHGEEIDEDENMINPVQCIGGSASCGTHAGCIKIIAGENVVVATAYVGEEYDVVIGVPKDFQHPDSKYLMDKEIENLPKFLECGRKYGPTIAYKLFHECMPALKEGDIKPLGDLIYEYRFNMGSIDNCSFVYPPINAISKRLAFLKLEGWVDVLALSSVGPGMFAVTRNTKKCVEAFEREGMNVLVTKPYNDRYQIVSKK
ncbi:MAG: hypothetical protein AAB917_02555 [Patescibacteria group bacterium]